jgi:hypothetical protein
MGVAASGPGRFIPQERAPVMHWIKAEWAIEPVLTLGRKDIIFF